MVGTNMLDWMIFGIEGVRVNDIFKKARRHWENEKLIII